MAYVKSCINEYILQLWKAFNTNVLSNGVLMYVHAWKVFAAYQIKEENI